MARKKHDTPRIVLRRQEAPLQLRNEVGSYLPPGAQYDYNPPSVFARYRLLTFVFGLIVLMALAYWALAPRFARRQEPAPAAVPAATPSDEPVYVLPVQPHAVTRPAARDTAPPR